MSRICPYCNENINDLSKDHIFPAFLGGSKKTDSCKSCNDRFGHSFEAHTAKMLQAMQVSMTSWGLLLNNSGFVWKGSHEYDGIKYDLSADGRKVDFSNTHPIVHKNDDGKTVAVDYRTKEEAEKAISNAKKKGKIGEVKKFSREILFSGARFTFNVDRNLIRTALKMCTAICGSDPRITPADTEYARAALATVSSDSPVPNVHIAFNSYESLDALRPALSHVIYVERSRSMIYGVVQFFGVIQLFCRIGRALPYSSDMAILGVLDPLENLEIFDYELNPLYLSIPPLDIDNGFDENMEKWLRKFEKSADEREATNPPNLSGKGVLESY